MQNLLSEDNSRASVQVRVCRLRFFPVASFSPFFQLSNEFHLDAMAQQDDDDATEELFICVTDPQEVGSGVSAYATYAVTGRASLPGFSSEFNLRRRFADFQWLYDEILRNSPGYVVPPLPEATVFQKFVGKFEAALLAYRTRELQRFVRRLASHSVLRNATQLQAFLSPDAEYNEHKSKNTATVANKAGSKFSALYGAVRKTVVATVPTLTGGPATERDDLVAQKTAYIEALGQGLVAADKSFHGLVEAHRALKGSLAMASEAASVMARSESFDESGSSQQNAWRNTANGIKVDHNALNDLVNQLQLEFEDRLHDYRRFVEQVQIVIQHRFGCLTQLVSAERNLEAKKNATKQVMADIEAAEQLVTETTATYERVNQLFKEEMARFEETKGKEITKAIARLGQIMVAYHLKAADSYKGLFL